MDTKKSTAKELLEYWVHRHHTTPQIVVRAALKSFGRELMFEDRKEYISEVEAEGIDPFIDQILESIQV